MSNENISKLNTKIIGIFLGGDFFFNLTNQKRSLKIMRIVAIIKAGSLLLLLLSRFSHVRLCATP